MQAPILIKSIPSQIVNELAAYGPFNLRNFIQSPDGDNQGLRFTGELTDGQSLPKGLICTQDGSLTGIPAKGTQGSYELVIHAENAEGSVQTVMVFIIKPSLLTTGHEYIDQLKARVWEAVGKNMPIPELGEAYEQAISMQDVYYLLERWGTLTIWNVFDLDSPGEKKSLQLEGANIHYDIYDRGCCLIAAPKDLFSRERTLADALQTAQVMAREVYSRKWTIEFTGFEKMVRAAWVEIKHLEKEHGQPLEILRFDPTVKDIRIYNLETRERILRKMEPFR